MNDYPESVMERWEKWKESNPHVFNEFFRKVIQLYSVGHRRYSARRIVEAMRWDYDLKAVGDSFLINSDYVPIMARKVAEYPLFKDFFEFREVRSRGIKSREQRKREVNFDN